MNLVDTQTELALLLTLIDASDYDLPETQAQLDKAALSEACFTTSVGQKLYRSIDASIRRGEHVDMFALPPDLRGEVLKMKGMPELVGIPVFSVPAKARRLKELVVRRTLMAKAMALKEWAQDAAADPYEALSRAQSELAGVQNTNSQPRNLLEVMQDVGREMDEVEAGASPLLETGIPGIDKLIGGLFPTVTVIGGDPGMGKSALLATITRNVAARGLLTAMFSLEDPDTWLGWRLLAAESGVNGFRLRTRKLTGEEKHAVGEGWGRIGKYGHNILIDDRPRLTPFEIVQTARNLIVNKGAKLVTVDHLGEVKLDSEAQRHDLMVGEALSDLRSIAKKYGCPIIVATHLKRRQDPQPKLSDFANSAAVERIARLALGVWRADDDPQEMVRVSVLKNTHGVKNVSCELLMHGPSATIQSAAAQPSLFNEEGTN